MDDLKNIYIDADTGDWVAKDPQGDYRTKPIIAMQVNPSTVWEITHNMGSHRFTLQVFSNKELVHPENVKIIDDNVIHVIFLNPIAGQANIMFFD